MASQRETILNTLVTKLAASAPNVKVVSNIDDKYPIDLDYTTLPAIKIHATDESVDYKTSLHAMNKISPDLYAYVIEWNMDSISAGEDFLKTIRNIIGQNLTLNNTCVNIDIRSIVKMEVIYPLILYKLNLAIWYDGNISNL